jgi:hypothetical protein
MERPKRAGATSERDESQDKSEERDAEIVSRRRASVTEKPN